MKFQGFSKIENSYRTKTVDFYRSVFGGEEWVVQEKIHGANASIWISEDGEVRFGKRSSFVPPETFYDMDIVMGELEGAIRALRSYAVGHEVTVFGELCGGSYPHKDVPPANVKRVQKGVHYHPSQKFIAFDLVVDGEYQNVSESMNLLSLMGFDTCPIIEGGTLDEVLDFNECFVSHLFEDLPFIEDNFAEGVVLKPNDPIFLQNGSRVILKKKNPKFNERSKEAKKVVSVELTDEMKKCLKDGLPYLNENRLRGVVGNHGPFTQKEFGRLLGAFVKDAVEDWRKDGAEINTLDRVDQKTVFKHMNKEAADIIRPHFCNILDGTF